MDILDDMGVSINYQQIIIFLSELPL